MTPAQADAMIAAINRLSDVAQWMFVVPESDELAAFFALGFIAPVTLFLVSYCVGVLVHFWRHH